MDTFDSRWAQKNTGEQPEGSTPAAETGSESSFSSVPGTFSLLYESRDAKLCIFEDASGHLSAVKTSRLA